MSALTLRITEKAKARIADLLAGREPGSVLALMYGSSTTYGPDGKLKDRTPARWQLQAYGKAQAASLEQDYTKSGWPFFHFVDGITLCVPQFQLLPELEGRTLDVEGKGISIK